MVDMETYAYIYACIRIRYSEIHASVTASAYMLCMYIDSRVRTHIADVDDVYVHAYIRRL